MAENAEMAGEAPHKGLQYTCHQQTAEEMNCNFEFSNGISILTINKYKNKYPHKGVQYTFHLQTKEEMNCNCHAVS